MFTAGVLVSGISTSATMVLRIRFASQKPLLWPYFRFARGLSPGVAHDIGEPADEPANAFMDVKSAVEI